MSQNVDSILHVKASENIEQEIIDDLKKPDGDNIQDLIDAQEKTEKPSK